jgi:DNA polymerase delta subunit 1
LVIGVAPERHFIADHHQTEPKLVFKVGVRTPNLITVLREAIGQFEEAGFAFHRDLRIRGPTYESGVRFENRFMLDHNIVGTGWVTLDANTYAVRESTSYTSRCQLEFDIDTNDIRGHTPTSNPEIYNTPSGLRVQSYDIECVSKTGEFPISSRDPVTNIHAVGWAVDKPDVLIADVAFVLGSAAAVGQSTTTTACFTNERDLLNAFGVFRILFDPDIVTGYNIANFDERYLMERAEVVGATQFLESTRLLSNRITGRIEVKHSKNLGNSEKWLGKNAGRVYIDMLYYVRNNMMQKLRSYTLNAVSAEVLKDQKEDVDHKQIPILFRGNQATRKRLADYCRKDALLPRQLMIKLSALVAMFEQTRVQRVQLDQQQNGGASFKVFAQLLAGFRAANYIVPYRGNMEKTDYQGATVIEPERGYYDDEPVGVEDFGSLYPSIAVAHNLCITTHVFDKDIPEVLAFYGFGEQYREAVEALQNARNTTVDVGDDDALEEQQALEKELEAKVKAIEDEVIYRCPVGHAYVRKKYKEGIFPRMLAELLKLRGEAKKLVALATTMLEKDVRTQREVALKISANSGYGFHGLPSNGTYWWWIAESITARGRQQIDMAKRLIEERFTIANGYPGNAHVIYGDTDSVMILFGIKIKDKTDRAEVVSVISKVMALSEEAAAFCTAMFEKPNTLNFENVYYPYLLINKKRYGGQVWMKPRSPDKPIVPEAKIKIKGLESVRRDNCRHVARTQERCMNLILRDANPAKAMSFAQQQIRKLLEDQVDFHDLVISGQLSKYFADYKTPQAHAYVRELMEKRNPGTGPKIGDRVPYVLVARDKKAKRYECAEDPVYAMEHNMPINTSYYLEHQMFEPLLRVFGPIYKDAEQQLKSGEHTRHIVKHISLEESSIAKFMKPRDNCKECGVSLTNETSCHPQGLICDNCEPQRISVVQQTLKKLRDLQIGYSRVWTNCQDCQGSRFKEIICTAQDCPVFYKRFVLKRDLEQTRAVYTKLGDTPNLEDVKANIQARPGPKVRSETTPTSSPTKKRRVVKKKVPVAAAKNTLKFSVSKVTVKQEPNHDDEESIHLVDLPLDW